MKFFMAGTNLLGGTAIIKGKDAKHMRVMRIKPGEDVIICDGKGTDYKCHYVVGDEEQAELQVYEVIPCPSEPNIFVHVCAGLPKGSDKVDYIIQKCVEAGASEVCFFPASRCDAKMKEPEKKVERWNKIAEAAAQQSGRGIIPEVKWLDEYAQALDIAYKSELGMFMYETGQREGMKDVIDANTNIKSATVITGPEGGFERFEADLAKACGLHICSMGERILRCETAPVVAVASIMYATGNM